MLERQARRPIIIGKSLCCTLDSSSTVRHFNDSAWRSRLPDKSAGGRLFASMKLVLTFCATFLSGLLCVALAQSPAAKAGKSDDNAQLQALARKIDEQNAKIDALSQEILKLEQQIAHIRPGVMMGGSK